MMYKRIGLVCVILALVSLPSVGQVAATATTPIKVNLSESLSLSVTTQLPTLSIAAGSLNSDTQNVVVTSSWNLNPSRTHGVYLCVSSSGALTGTAGNSDMIPVSSIYVTPSSGSSTAVALGSATANCGITGAVTVKMYPTTSASGRKNLTGQSDSIPVQVQLSNNIAADSYTGTLTITAYTN